MKLQVNNYFPEFLGMLFNRGYIPSSTFELVYFGYDDNLCILIGTIRNKEAESTDLKFESPDLCTSFAYAIPTAKNNRGESRV